MTGTTPVPESATFDFPWQKDGLTKDEQRVLNAFQTIERENPALAQTVLISFPWLADGITRDESWVLQGIMFVAGEDASLAQRLVDLPWLKDGITFEERDAFGYTWSIAYNIAGDDLSRAQRFVNFPWISDGLDSESEYLGLVAITQLILGDLQDQSEGIRPDVSLALRVLDFPWLADDLTAYEMHAITLFNSLNQVTDSEVAISFADSPLFDGPIGRLKSLAYGGVVTAVWKGTLEQLVRQPWYQDGLTDDELLLMSLLTGQHLENENFLQGLRQQLRAETFSLRLAGEVRANVLSNAQYQSDDFFQALHTSMETIEDFMGVPWPDPYPVIYIVPPGSAAGHYSRLTDRTTLAAPPDLLTLYHELGHRYFHDFPHWLNEGAAQFLEAYVEHRNENLNLQTRYRQVERGCPTLSISNIHQLLEVSGSTQNTGFYDQCAYTVGEAFWLGMYLSLGHEVVLSYLRELYLVNEASTSGQTLSTLDVWGEADIYQVLLSNTPPEKQDQFRDLYRRLHGGPTPGS